MIKVLRHPSTLLLVAFFAQVLMGVLGAEDANYPMGDVIFAYKPWFDGLAAGGRWLGVSAPWVYPYPVLAPIVFAHFIWPVSYLGGWLAMAILLNMAALSWLVLRNRETVMLGWFWLAATLALGPVSLSRIDGISVALGLFALSSLQKRSLSMATIWFAAAAWLKVWPVALIASLAIVVRNRTRVLGPAVLASIAILAFGIVLGGNQNLVSFVFAQGNRGVQIESFSALPWMWSAAFGGDASVYYDINILTYQVKGQGAEIVGSLSTIVMALAFAVTSAIGWLAVRRGRSSGDLMATLSLLFTLEFIVFNKVGSPQYLGWLILPVLLGLMYRVPRWKFAIFGVLVASLATQLIYPLLYDRILALDFWPLILLSARNLLELALLIWAFVRLAKLVFEKQPKQVADNAVFD